MDENYDKIENELDNILKVYSVLSGAEQMQKIKDRLQEMKEKVEMLNKHTEDLFENQEELTSFSCTKIIQTFL